MVERYREKVGGGPGRLAHWAEKADKKTEKGKQEDKTKVTRKGG